jgi:DNA invertase Pin-like site-specific DNA recombinase
MSSLPTAVLYARVSSKEQEKEGFSIPAQQKLLRQYALDHGISVACEFTDVETAKRSGRTGFGDMLSYLRGHADCRIILVEKTDRLYRNLRDWVTIDELNIEVHFVKQGSVISRDSRSSDKFIHGIQVLMAKNYVDNLSEETRKGMLEKAEQGMWPSFAPLGYLNSDRTIVPDPVLGPIVRQLFEWYATGEVSLAELTKKARAAGLFFRKSGATVPKSTIHKILHNRIYTGDFDFNGKLYRGKYEPIITRELYEQVQRRPGRRQRQKHDFAFSGFITCGHCGCSLVGERKKGRYVYYHCASNCSRAYVREEVLEAKFGDVIRDLVFTDEMLEAASRAIGQSAASEQRQREQVLQRLRTEQTKLQRRLGAMYDDKLDGLIDAEVYKTKSAEIQAEQARLAQQIAGLETVTTPTTCSVAELAKRAAELFEQQPATEKRKLLRYVVEGCTWRDGQLAFQWRQPFGQQQWAKAA